MVRVTVLGAGTVGLVTALELKLKYPYMDITVAASHLPGDIDISYTSPFAGANWLSTASPDNKNLQDLDVEAYCEFLKLADDPKSGIWRKKNALFFSQKALDEVHGDVSQWRPWFYNIAGGRVLQKHELLRGAVYGIEYDGVVISVPTYLPYLVQKCLGLGIVVRRVAAIQHIEQARNLHHSGELATYVINCAGLGASQIGGVNDLSRNYPIRGQVLVVRNTISKAVVFSGFETPNEELYVFPRKEGGAIIGGSFHVDDLNAAEDLEMTKRIKDRALEHLPELTDVTRHGNPPHLDVVKVNVGLRPAREAGPRIERDVHFKWLIHSYGAGGGGYQGSYGFARRVCKILGDELHGPKL